VQHLHLFVDEGDQRARASHRNGKLAIAGLLMEIHGNKHKEKQREREREDYKKLSMAVACERTTCTSSMRI
jgi:hypothetical protein